MKAVNVTTLTVQSGSPPAPLLCVAPSGAKVVASGKYKKGSMIIEPLPNFAGALFESAMELAERLGVEVLVWELGAAHSASPNEIRARLARIVADDSREATEYMPGEDARWQYLGK